MLTRLPEYENFLHEKKAERRITIERIRELELNYKVLKSRLEDLNEAVSVINIVGVMANDDSKSIIEGIVTEALQLIYDESYSFIIDTRIQRDQPESYLSVKIGENEYSLRDEELGGGVIDVVSFTLRVTMWAISDPQVDDVLMLDEPLRNLDSERLTKMGVIIKKLSDSLGIQFLIVTHEPQLAEAADSTWYVKKSNGTSKVEVV
jgi:DNA repair exonuclease SbcCD ATPase subunit